MSHAKGDYRWWDLDGTELGALLYNILTPIQLGDEDYGNDWANFEKLNPAGAYAWRVGSRHEVLDQAVIALRPVQKFVRLRRLPIATTKGNITREEWLRATIDLFLFRIGGIRDHCLHLVADVFELGLPPLEVRLNRIASAEDIEGTQVETLIRHVASIGSELRGERNRRAHEGIQRPLSEEPFFKVLSLFEQVGSKRKKRPPKRTRLPKDGSIPFQDVTSSDEYDLPAVYRALAVNLKKEFLPLGDQIVQAVRELTDELCDHFSNRFDRKKAGAA